MSTLFTAHMTLAIAEEQLTSPFVPMRIAAEQLPHVVVFDQALERA